MVQPGPAQSKKISKKKPKKSFQKKFMIFQRTFLWTLLNIGLYFYIVKIQNLVLKYLVFIETLQNNYKTKKKSCFHTYSQVSQRLKKNKQTNHIVFSYNKNSKKKMFSMHFDFNNQFIKAIKTRPIFQKYPKNILFSFSIWEYEFIHKTYSWY
jgi:hypothetical protein